MGRDQPQLRARREIRVRPNDTLARSNRRPGRHGGRAGPSLWWPTAVVAAIAVAGGGGFLALKASEVRVDSSVAAPVPPPAGAGPRVRVPAEIAPSVPGFVSTLRGLVDGATSLTANGNPVVLEPGGSFTTYIAQGVTAVDVVATNAAGEATAVTVGVTATPRPSEYPLTAAVHVRASEWSDEAVHQQILAMIGAGTINAVELDIKDEAGEVGYASSVAFAGTTGAIRSHYDARAAIDELHQLGARAIGRIVCFLDPVAAGWAWANGRPDMIVLDGTGTAPLDNNYGTAAFTNVANADIRQYQIDLATEAVALGFDEILYDYVRRPEGDMANMQFPGLDASPDVTVARFVATTNDELAPSGARLGVSVFGIAATRPAAIGQDIGLLAPNVDYVSPMVYPSHWGPGEYGVADPVRQPAEIVSASLADFERVVAGSGAAVVPWLQDFSAGGVTYGTAEVRAQIDAATAAGSRGFLLWNPTSTYHADALSPIP